MLVSLVWLDVGENLNPHFMLYTRDEMRALVEIKWEYIFFEIFLILSLNEKRLDNILLHFIKVGRVLLKQLIVFDCPIATILIEIF